MLAAKGIPDGLRQNGSAPHCRGSGVLPKRSNSSAVDAARDWRAALPGASARSGQVATTSSGRHLRLGRGRHGRDRPAPVDGKRLQSQDGLCAQTSGAYLAEVNVTIVDAANKVVLDTLAEGPWFSRPVARGNLSGERELSHHTRAPDGRRRRGDAQHGRIAVAQ